MITLIDWDGRPVAIATTGVHTKEECLAVLIEMNAEMAWCGLKGYKEVVDQDGKRYSPSENL